MKRWLAGIGVVGVLIVACWTPLVFAKGAHVEEATEQQKKAAEKHFATGASLFGKSRFDDALEAFRASYDIVASPNSHLLVARTLSKLNKYDEAYAEYEAVITEAAVLGDRYSKAGKSAQKERGQIRDKIALVQIRLLRAGAGAEVRIGDRRLDENAWSKPVPVLPGTVTIEARSTEGTTMRKIAEAEAGGSIDVELELPEPVRGQTKDAELSKSPPGDTRPAGVKMRRTIAYVSGGVGVAALATGGVFAAIDHDKYDDVVLGSLVVGGLALTTGVIMYVTSEGASDSSNPDVAVGPGSILVRGRF